MGIQSLPPKIEYPQKASFSIGFVHFGRPLLLFHVRRKGLPCDLAKLDMMVKSPVFSLAEIVDTINLQYTSICPFIVFPMYSNHAYNMQILKPITINTINMSIVFDIAIYTSHQHSHDILTIFQGLFDHGYKHTFQPWL